MEYKYLKYKSKYYNLIGGSIQPLTISQQRHIHLPEPELPLDDGLYNSPT